MSHNQIVAGAVLFDDENESNEDVFCTVYPVVMIFLLLLYLNARVQCYSG